MKRLFFILTLLLLSVHSYAQPIYDALRDQVWVTGYHFTSLDTTQLMWLDFRGDTMVIQKKFGLAPPIDFMNGTICDEDGDLLFYSNGCEIADASYNDLLNGMIMNDGPNYDRQCDGIFGSPISSGLVVLPLNASTFSILHLRYDLNGTIPFVDQLLETRVLQTADGLELQYTDSLILASGTPEIYWGNMATVRHGNGTAWWLILPQNLSNHYNKILITEDSITLQGEQDIGEESVYQESGGGEAAFSQEGTKYARYLPLSDLRIFDFDRCTGAFSNPIHIPIQDIADTLFSTGLAFSPSGRFLYLSSNDYVYQLDMEAENIAASRITVAVYDGFEYNNFSTRFGKMELGPDGKIYMACPTGRPVIHVIESPDSLGLACDLRQHKFIEEEASFSGGLPAFPNFRLGPSDPVCGLVADREPIIKSAIKIYPNPNNGRFTIEMNVRPEQAYQIIIYNGLGQEQSREMLSNKIQNLELSTRVKGLYFLSIKDQLGKVIRTERIFIQ